MVRSKNNGGSTAGIPDGQLSRGPGAANLPNPKVQPGSSTDSLGPVAGDGGAALAGMGVSQTSTHFDGSQSPNNANKGSAATEPDPATVNRGYTNVDTGNVPQITLNCGANRQHFGIDDGAEVLTPPGDTTDRPVKPSYGSGSTHD